MLVPTISPSLIPTVSPGTIFTQLTTDDSLNIRWISINEPVHFSVMNRPIADVAVRQLIMAKALDALNLRLSHQSNFPFLTVAKVDTGTTEFDLPASWIWDLHASVPKKWENLRLAKIKRISGTNSDSAGEITGKLRLIFTANEQGSAVEVSLFQADYQIDSILSFQVLRLSVVTASEESNAVDAGESETITGFLIFRTLDTTDQTVIDFFTALAPPVGGTDADADGLFDSPEVYEIVNSVAGGELTEDDFSLSAINHGTGILVASAWNAIPSLDSDVNTWLATFNFPFRLSATRQSFSPITVTIPSPLFSEFDLCVPCSDEPTGDNSGEFSPVWISKIRRLDTGADRLQFFFATFNIKDDVASVTPIDFATLTLERNSVAGQIVEIEPIDDLQLDESSGQELFRQGFGRGHVALSSLWSGTTSVIDDFFDAFQSVLDDPADVSFTKSSSILGAPGALSRSSRTTPTQGQHEALAGSSARLEVPVHPSDENRYITEQDQGLGDEVDFRLLTGFTENEDIESIAHTGALAHRIVFLTVDSSGDNHSYDTDILPRLRVLFGRDPQAGDQWFDGTILKMFIPAGVWVDI